MSDDLKWLPDLVTLEASGNSWDEYLKVIYAHYCHDFKDSKPMFRGQTVSVKWIPIIDGKDCAFWHLISEGMDEDNRTPDLRRCERIRWPRPFIENSQCGPIRCWQNKRGNETRICVWLEEKEYLVVLAQRRDKVLLWTAYPVDRRHTRDKLRKEYEASLKS